jgi:S-DNA-T family DNA segregation ATPase FtsK/SpoIIIE
VDRDSHPDFAAGPRLSPPEFGTDDVPIAAPPTVPQPTSGAPITRLLPLVIVVAMVGMSAATFTSGSPLTRNPSYLLFPLMMLVSVVTMVVQGGNGGRRTASLNHDRNTYLDYLSTLADTVTETARVQRASMYWCHPNSESLWMLVGGPRMWERRPADSDFCHVRVGRGTQRLARALLVPQTAPVDQLDPVTTSALRGFIRTNSTVADLPIAIALRGLSVVTVDGHPDDARALVRAMVCQLAVLHSPRDLMVVAVAAGDSCTHWDWLKWLPHSRHRRAADAGAMVYPSFAAANAALGSALTAESPHVVVIVDGEVIARGELTPTEGITVIGIGSHCDRGATGARLGLKVTADRLAVTLADREQIFARPDRMSITDAAVCARRLARYRAAPTSRGQAGASPRWHQLLEISDPAAIDPTTMWRHRPTRDRLRVPIGTTADGAPVELDIKEAAQHGTGPHGLCVGATGSGKSELLRSIALGMITRHSPESLNLVLIDFKGGATFLDVQRAPHVAAVITNLSDEAHLVARLKDALAGEMNRRQELLRAAGNVVNIADYERSRRAGAALPALPALFIIVDEFSELLSRHPDFADTFVAIGRLGRSLGMHLLLASQRLDEGRLRGLETQLSYRICLKTLSDSESRIALGSTAAHHLPNTPGAAYLRTGTADLIRFQTAFVSGPYEPDDVAAPPPTRTDPNPTARLFTAAPRQPVAVRPVLSESEPAPGRTVLDTVLDRLAGHGPPAHQIWLPPLDESPPLDAVMSGTPGHLVAPVGFVDRPFEQRRTPLLADLSGAAGNVAIVGAPQSGKSTTVRTLVTALAVNHDPDQVAFYCLDFGGGSLAALGSLPHVGSVATRREEDKARRTIADLAAIARSREVTFCAHGVDSMAEFRRRKARRDPALADDPYGDVVLVVDGWAAVRRDFDALEEPITALAAQGLSFGVHVVVTAARWADIRPALKDQLGTRIELRLGDPADSEADRRQAQHVPVNRPGRGLTRDGLHMVIALPRLDGLASPSDLTAAAEATGAMLRRRHGDCAAPPIRLLPPHVDQHALLDGAGAPDTRVLLGLGEDQLKPTPVEFDREPHMLILGDSECGKTAALRTLCRELTRTRSPAQATVFLVDYRRTLRGVVRPERLAGYAMSAAALTEQLPALLDLLRARMPLSDVSTEQLRTRSWWSGPDVFVVVDDYDLVSAATGNPLTPILEFLPHAKDLGLHVIVARRCGGAARALFEPLLAQLRDLGSLGLQMSGNPDEGPLIGSVRPSPLPPGRGTLITRHGDAALIQVGWCPPP